MHITNQAVAIQSGRDVYCIVTIAGREKKSIGLEGVEAKTHETETRGLTYTQDN